VWWARRRSIGEDFDLHVVVSELSFNTPNSGWMMRPIERLDEPQTEFGHFESQFQLVENGGHDAWIKGRIA